MSMIFAITEQATGWFVGTSGPFLTKERATSLAEGMAFTLQAFGTKADIAMMQHPPKAERRKPICRVIYLDC